MTIQTLGSYWQPIQNGLATLCGVATQGLRIAELFTTTYKHLDRVHVYRNRNCDRLEDFLKKSLEGFGDAMRVKGKRNRLKSAALDARRGNNPMVRIDIRLSVTRQHNT